jgi:hypothetical protein
VTDAHTVRDVVAALLAARDLDAAEELRERLDPAEISDETSEGMSRVLAEWSDPLAVGNLLLCADLLLPAEFAVPAVERAVAATQPDARLAACAAVGAQRLADADLLEEPLRERLVSALVAAAGTRRDAAAARAGYALISLAEPADAGALLALADADVEVVRHNTLALLVNLLGVRGLAELVTKVEGQPVADRTLGGALQARVALGKAGVDVAAPVEELVPPGHPLRSYLLSEIAR